MHGEADPEPRTCNSQGHQDYENMCMCGFTYTYVYVESDLPDKAGTGQDSIEQDGIG